MQLQFSNESMRVTVRPDLGGRIDQITDLRSGKDWLWHPPTYDASKSRRLEIGASFDDNWTGGWDDVFPNDPAGDFQGWKLADHGELWSQSWSVIEKSDRGVKLARRCQTVPVDVEKTIVLAQGHPELEISYLFKNGAAEPVPFFLKMHPAIAIEEGDELLMPPCDVEPVELGFSRLIGKPGLTRFPTALAADGSEIRVDKMLARSEAREFFYCSDLESSECGVRNTRTGTTLRFEFERTHFPFVWSFQSFGGFHGHYVMILEPCTSKPYDLEKAQRQGSLTYLSPKGEPGDMREIRLRVRIEQT